MAGETNGSTALENTEHIPIAQLSPELAAPSTRSIKAVITLTWPYSSATGSVAFLLSEPDFRLRRTRGQVRVRFSGSSAKIIAASGIASGDEVTLCLDGVEWVPEDGSVVTPGRGIEFGLRFTERLLLQFKQEDSGETKKVDIDHPAAAEELPLPAQFPTPEPEQPPLPTNTESSAHRTIVDLQEGDEFSSPAFMKRGRESYGSLFESDYDPFAEEDGSIRGKGRKRLRFSSTWTYQSRSPTPEADEPEVETMDISPKPALKPVPTMTDEGCQTVNFDDKDTAKDMAQALADFSRQATNVGTATYSMANGLTHLEQLQSDAPTEAGPENEVQLPEIRTEALKQGIDKPTLDQEVPKSPTLQPIPSDSLSLVSPLLPTKYGLFSQPNGQPHVDEQENIFNGEPEVTTANRGRPDEPEEEDIYSASPAGRREQNPGDFQGFQEDPTATTNVEIPNFEEQFTSENQYGHWQSAGARLSHSASPSGNEIFTEGTHGDRFYGGHEEDQHVSDNLLVTSGRMHHSEYPPLDDGTLGQVSSNWGANSVVYPDLHDLNGEPSTYPHPPPRSAAISHSHSGQSVVVDLTESDDDAVQDALLDSSEDEFEGPHEVEGEGQVRYDRQQDLVIDRHDEDDAFDEFEGSQDSARDEEGGYEDDLEEEELGEEGFDEHGNYVRLPPGINSDFEDEEDTVEYDEEEGSYEEEMEEDGIQRWPPIQRTPEVIDLLSSDDEDEPSKSPLPTTSNQESPSREPRRSASSPRLDVESDEDSEDQSEDEDAQNEESEEDESVPYAERSEIKTSITRKEMVSPSLEEDDEDAIYREDDLDAIEQYEDNDADQQNRQMPPTTVSIHGESESDGDSSGNLEPDLQAHADEQDSNLDEAEEVQTPGPAPQSKSMEIDSPTKPVQELLPSPPKVSPIRPSLFSRMFDGANDEPQFGASYTSLQKEELTPPSSTLVQEVASQALDHQIPNQNKGQLPTPEETQNSNKVVSAGVSFSSATELQPPEISPHDDEMDVDQIVASLPITRNEEIEIMLVAEETRAVSVEAESIEIEAVQTSTIKFEVQTHLDEVKTSSIVDAIEVDQPGEVVEPSDEQDLEESHGLAETIASTESTSKIMIEEKKSVANHGELGSHDAAADSKLEQFNVHDNTVEEGPEFTLESPRRSTRRANPTLKATANAKENVQPVNKVRATVIPTTGTEDANLVSPLKSPTKPAPVKENIRPVTPVKPHERPPTSSDNDQQSPIVVIETQATPKGHDASIDLALEATDSHSPPAHNLRRSRVTSSEPIASSPPVQHTFRKIHIDAPEPVESSPLPQHNLRQHVATSEAAESSPPPQHNLRSTHLATSEATDSSPPPQHDSRRPPAADVKLRLKRALRTELSEFTSLKVLRFHLNQKLDVLGVATTTPPDPQRAKNGPRHYQITFNVTDPSIAPSGVIEVQVFRPYKDALPIIKVGDGILLRNFQVTSVKNRGFTLRSTQEEASSWAVFKDEDEVEVRGPPVEYGDGEKNHVKQLKTWYESLDDVALAKIARANGDKAGAGTAAGKSIRKGF